MKRLLQPHPAMAAILLAAMVTTLAAPFAEAGPNRKAPRRYKGVPVVREQSCAIPSRTSSRVTYVHRNHSDAGVLIAGLIGGFVLGSAVSNAQPVVHASYSYWDPYCEVSFSSLDGCRAHFRHHRHPRVVRVMDVSNGHYVRNVCWSDNAWREYHGDWRHADDRYHGGW